LFLLFLLSLVTGLLSWYFSSWNKSNPIAQASVFTMTWGVLRLRMEERPPIWPCKWNLIIIYIVAKMFILLQSNRWKPCSYFHQKEIPVHIAPVRITESSPFCCKAFSLAKPRNCTQTSSLIWIRLMQCNRGKGKVRLMLSLYMSWGHTGVVAVWLHSFFGTRWRQAFRLGPQPLYDQERVPYRHWIGGCVGFSIRLDGESRGKCHVPVGIRIPEYPARSLVTITYKGVLWKTNGAAFLASCWVGQSSIRNGQDSVGVCSPASVSAVWNKLTKGRLPVRYRYIEGNVGDSKS
jgi:hypothetical protein